MSWGIVICSKCNREVVQNDRRDEHGRYVWFHRADDSPCCDGAERPYAPDGWREPENPAPKDAVGREALIAQFTAHRAVGNQEQDADNGKLAGYCIVCQIPWPCEYAKPLSQTNHGDTAAGELHDLREFIKSLNSFAFEEWHGHYRILGGYDPNAFHIFDGEGNSVADGEDALEAIENFRKENQ